MAADLERKIMGVVFVLFGVAQYAITVRKLWHAAVPRWWIRMAHEGRVIEVVRDEFFPHDVLLVLGPFVCVGIGLHLLIAGSNSLRSWSIATGAMGVLVALGLWIGAWGLAIYFPLFAAYLLALLWIALRAHPRPNHRSLSETFAP